MLKRAHPYSDTFYQAEDVLFDDAETAENKRRRFSLAPPLRLHKREREASSEALYTATDLEHARVEGRLQVLARCEAALSAYVLVFLCGECTKS